MNAENELSAEKYLYYEHLVAKCLEDRLTEKVWVISVVSATDRGTTLHLENSTTGFAFKFVQATADLPADSKVDFPYLCATIKNEAAILNQIQEHTHDLFVAEGTFTEQAWVMTRWLAGPSAARHARQFRQKQQEQIGEEATAARRGLLTLIAEMFNAVANLHDLGYTHGDIQPAHLLYDAAYPYPNGGPRLSLIDFGLARQQGQAGIPYRGALVHFAAPEIAAAMREGANDIAYDELSEIYSVASVAFQLYTGKTTTDYGNDNPRAVSFHEILSRIADSGLSTRRTFASTGAVPFPALEIVLEQCLLPNRADRCPSLRRASKELQTIANEYG